MALVEYNCASYLRLSREDDRTIDESSSIQNQRLIVNDFSRHNNLKIVKEYVDDGYSGGNFDRPSFNLMLKAIDDGLINCVITKDLSRLGREIYGTGKYIEEVFLEKGVRYIAINDSYDSNIGDSMLGLRLGVNDLYLRDVSKKVKSAYKAKQEQGLYLGSIACYGYIKDPDNKYKLKIDERVADNVKFIYEMALGGAGLHVICRTLTDRKIPIPIVHKKEVRGLEVKENDGCGVWKRATVRNILTSRMYVGDMVQNQFSKISYKAKKIKKNSEDKLVIVKGTHEAIISEKDFDKVQELLKKRSKLVEVNDNRYLLSGLMVCGDCGHLLGVSRKELKSKTSLNTYCNFFARKGKHSGCSNHRVDYSLLELDVIEYLKELAGKFISTYDDEIDLKEAIYSYHNSFNTLEKDKKNIEDNLSKLKQKLNLLYNDKYEQVISLETYKDLSAIVERDITIQKEKLEKIKKGILNYDEREINKNFENCKKSMYNFLELKEINKTTIKSVIKKIEVFENKEIIIHFKFKEMAYLVNNIKKY